MIEINLKKELYNKCTVFVNKKLETIEKIIKSNQNALESETKSSAGDKHETGRAMLQLEMEKAGQQLNEVQQMQLIIAKVNLEESSEIIRLGSVVKTNNASYFIAISAGKLTLENKDYYAVSPSSPIGKMLLGKSNTDKINFNGRVISIEGIL